MVKGHDCTKQRSIAAKKTAKAVQRILQDPPEVGHVDTILFSNRTVLTRPARYQKMLMRQVKTAVRKEQIRRRREQAESRQQLRMETLKKVAQEGPRTNARRQTNLSQFLSRVSMPQTRPKPNAHHHHTSRTVNPPNTGTK